MKWSNPCIPPRAALGEGGMFESRINEISVQIQQSRKMKFKACGLLEVDRMRKKKNPAPSALQLI